MTNPPLALLARDKPETRDALRSLLETLVKIPAPSFGESARAEFIRDFMKDAGLTRVEIDSEGNAIGELCPSEQAAREKALYFVAHMDTVFPLNTPLEIRREGNRWFCPGIGDNTASVAVMLTAARLLAESGSYRHLRRRLVFACSVGEEGLGDLRGVKRLFSERRDDVAACLGVDSVLGAVVTEVVATLRYKVTLRGPGGHSWADAERPSPVHEIGGLIAELAGIKTPAEPRTTFNIGVVSGGTAVNAIAASAEILLDLRSVSARELDRLDKKVLEIIDGYPIPRGLDKSVDKIGNRPGGVKISESRIVKVISSVLKKSGTPVRYSASSTDANLPVSLGIEATTSGVYSGGGAHTLNEYVDTSSLLPGLEIFLEWVAALDKAF